MSQLCYLPKPAEFEGPKSLLMRMAHYNGFGTVRNMCAYFAFNPRRWVDVLGQNSPLLKIVDKEAPIFADDLRKAFYNVAANNSQFIKADDISLLRGACPNTFYYCPQCIEASQSPIFHDIRNIGMCLLHGTELISVCPNCRTSEHWYNAQLFHCKCDFERRTANRIVANFTPRLLDPFQSPQVAEDIQLKYVIAKVCASLWDARRNDQNHKSCDLPLKVINHIHMTVAAQVVKYPGFIKSLHSRPAKPLLISALGIGLLAIGLPYSPAAPWFGLVPLPLPMLAVILTISAVYMVTAEQVKRIFYRRQRSKRHRKYKNVSRVF